MNRKILALLTAMFALPATVWSAPATQPTTRASSTQAANSSWITYTDPKRHFHFEYPPSWELNDKQAMVAHYTDVFVAINSAGKRDLTVRQLQTKPNQWELGSVQIAQQVPRGGAYIEVNWLDFPQDRYGKNAPEMEADNLTEPLKSSDENHGNEITSRDIHFFKWGRNWHVVVYLHEPVAAAVKDEVHNVLASFRFDGVPSGDEIWAIGEARKSLPAEADAEHFTREGGSREYYCQTRVDGSDVIVTFTKHVGDSSPKSWSYRVDPNGDVKPIDDKRDSK